MPGSSFWGRKGYRLSVLAQDAEDASLNRDLRGRNIDRLHFDVRRLQSNGIPFRVEALQGGFTAAHQCNDNLALAGSPSPLHQNIVPVDDVLVAHGVPANLKGKHIAISHD